MYCIFSIVDDTCFLGTNAALPGDDSSIMVTVQLKCTVINEVPRPIPPPTLRWFRNGVKAAHATFGEAFSVDTNFLMKFPILTTGVFGLINGSIISTFQVLASGELLFNTLFDNIMNAVLGNLSESTTPAQARAMLFDILLGNWTCVANNSLGTSAVEHHIGICGKLEPRVYRKSGNFVVEILS